MATFLDAFAGIGGFHLACRSAVHKSKCVGFVENDPTATKVYQDNFDSQHFEDITTLEPSTLPDFDVLFAGFPCQPFSQNSVTGRFVDMDDPRTGLFLNLVNICEVKQPEYFVFENVPKFTSLWNFQGIPMIELLKRKFERIGYRVKWKILNASRFGVPQQRNRLYIVGTNTGKQLTLPDEASKPKTVREIIDPAATEVLLASEKLDTSMLTTNKKRIDVLKESFQPIPPASQYSPQKLAAITNDTPSGAARQSEKVYSIDTVSPTVTTFNNPYFDVDGLWRKLTVKETKRLFGIPDSFKLPEDYATSIKLLGNSICVPVVTEIIKHLRSDR